MKNSTSLTLILSQKKEEGELPALPCNTSELVCASAHGHRDQLSQSGSSPLPLGKEEIPG
jgi:hypothetical protein